MRQVRARQLRRTAFAAEAGVWGIRRSFWWFDAVKTAICVVAILLLLSLPAVAEQQGFQDELLDHMAGNWVLSGTIGGAQVTHDLVAGWVLGHQYLRFHEVAREVDDEGAPAYEAIVFIGWDQTTSRYTCLWLDVTGSGGQFPEASSAIIEITDNDYNDTVPSLYDDIIAWVGRPAGSSDQIFFVRLP